MNLLQKCHSSQLNGWKSYRARRNKGRKNEIEEKRKKITEGKKDRKKKEMYYTKGRRKEIKRKRKKEKAMKEKRK